LDFGTVSVDGSDTSKHAQVLGMGSETAVGAVGSTAPGTASAQGALRPVDVEVLGTSGDVYAPSDNASFPIPRFRGDPVASQDDVGGTARTGNWPNGEVAAAATGDHPV